MKIPRGSHLVPKSTFHGVLAGLFLVLISGCVWRTGMDPVGIGYLDRSSDLVGKKDISHLLGDHDALSRIIAFDLDTDGTYEVAQLIGTWITGSDAMTIYQANRDLSQAQSLSDLLDTRAQSWMIDTGADGSVNLVVQFSTDQGAVVANIYDDVDGDGEVDAQMTERGIEVRETSHPTVVAKAPTAWRNRESQVSPNIEFAVDGRLPQRAWNYPLDVQNLIVNDGKPDFSIRVVDEDGDGIPDYHLWRFLGQVSQASGIYRAILHVNSGEMMWAEPLGQGSEWFWPLLRPSGVSSTSNYFDTPPIIDVNWAEGMIEEVGLLGYPIEQGWHVTTIQPIRLQRVNNVDFEIPMAYYDLENDDDGLPELHVRIEALRKGDTYSPGTAAPETLQDVRYSWALNSDDLTWDYKLGLAGLYPIQGQVDFSAFSLSMVPPSELPRWVIGREWPAMTFVATDGNSYRSSEGIYEWPAASLGIDYLFGRSDTSEAEALTHLPDGFRGEFRIARNGVPELYYSPVDRRLHLVGAQAGLWNLGNGRNLLLNNVGSDPYLNAWILAGEEADPKSSLHDVLASSSESLFHLDSYMLHADVTGLHLAPSGVPMSSYRLQPPRDHGEWEQHRRRLAPGDLPVDPGDPIRSILDRHDLHWETLEGGRLIDVAAGDSDGEYYVYLELPQTIQPPAAFDATEPRVRPGRYILSVADDVHLRSVDSVGFRINEIDLVSEGSEWVAGRPGVILVRVENSGDWPLRQRLVVVQARTGAGGWIDIGSPSVSVPPHGAGTAKATWSPDRAGEWDLRVQVRGARSGEIIDQSQTANISVSAADTQIGLWSFEPLGIGSPALLLYLGIAALFAGMAVATRLHS